MAAAPLEIYAEILALSRRMLSLAQAGNWDELAAQEAERQQVVDKLKKKRESAAHLALAPGDKTRVDALIQTILKLDEETVALTERHMADIKESLATVSVSRQLNSTYLRP